MNFRTFKPSFLPLVALCSLAFFHPLLETLVNGIEFFVVKRSTPFELFSFVLLLALVVPAALFLILWAIFKIWPFAGVFFYFLTFAVLFSLVLTPIFFKQFLLPGVYAVTLALILGLAVAVLAAKYKAVHLFTAWLSVFPIISAASFFFDKDVRTFIHAGFSRYEAPTPVKSNDTPVVFIVFDEFPLSSILSSDLSIDELRFPNFAQLAKSSHWFRNATAVSTHTNLAMAAILTGRYPSQHRRLPIFESHPQNLFTLLGASHQMHALEPLSSLCPESLCGVKKKHAAYLIQMWRLLKDSTAVLLRVIVPKDIDLGLPEIGMHWDGFWKEGKHNFGTAYTRRIGRLELFQRFIEKMQNTERPGLHFGHHMLPHVPYQFSPSGKLFTGREFLRACVNDYWQDDPWGRAQGYQQFLFQAGATDRGLGRLISHLKNINLFDKSLLIITADHGASFDAFDHRRGEAERPNFFEDIMSIPLFIKLPFQTLGEINDRNVESIDIFPTIADVLKLPLKEAIDGMSVFSTAPARPKKKMVLGQKGVDVRRKSWGRAFDEVLFDNPSLFPRKTLDWKLSLFGENPSNPFRLNPKDSNLGITVPKINQKLFNLKLLKAFGLSGTKTTLRYDPKERNIPLLISGSFNSTPDTPKGDIYLSLNNSIVAMAKLFPARQKSDQAFDFIITEQDLKPGENPMRILIRSQNEWSELLPDPKDFKSAY